jgi:hypothetical protein
MSNLINPEDKFWSLNQDNKPFLNNFKFRRFLEMKNYFKNKPNPQSSFNIIQRNGIFLEIKDEVDVKDFVLDYVLNNNLGEDVYNLLTGKMTTFKRDFLSQISTLKIDALKDTKDTCYLFYENGVVEVKKDSQILKPYDNFGLSIWKDQVIKRNYIESDHHNSKYREFIWKISGENVDRYNTFQTVIGYLIHSYKSKGNNKAIILNDEMISDEPNGRSGKGLFWNALSNMKKVQSIDGKKFSFNDAFPYQSIKTDCQVLVFDDVKRNFTFENLFSVITEGIEITYKGKDTIKLPVEDSPKILITTNYVLKGNGGSHDARKFEVELSSFFNANYTPFDYFGHMFFDDWGLEEFARFDCYIIECVKKYLTNGLMNYESISLPFKKLEVEISKDLMDCIEQIKSDEWIESLTFYGFYENQLVNKFDRNKKSKNMVTKCIQKYCDFFNYQYETVSPGGIKKFKIVKTKVDPKTLDIWTQIEQENGIN